MVEFTVVGRPKGKGRPRFVRGHAYTPPETKAYEAQVRWAFQTSKGYKFHGAVGIVIDAYFKPPKATAKLQLQRMMEHDIRPPKKPDVDNIAKIVMDALNGLAYDDDKQIVELTVRKWYGHDNCVTVRLYDEGIAL